MKTFETHAVKRTGINKSTEAQARASFIFLCLPTNFAGLLTNNFVSLVSLLKMCIRLVMACFMVWVVLNYIIEEPNSHSFKN